MKFQEKFKRLRKAVLRGNKVKRMMENEQLLVNLFLNIMIKYIPKNALIFRQIGHN